MYVCPLMTRVGARDGRNELTTRPSTRVRRRLINMDVEKLQRLAGSVRTGGKGSVRR